MKNFIDRFILSPIALIFMIIIAVIIAVIAIIFEFFRRLFDLVNDNLEVE